MPGGGAPWVAGCCATVRKKKTNHGLNGYLEMQQLHEAGLSLEQIFQAATINNAREFKLDSQVGTIEPGKIANLVLLRKSPLVGADAYDSIATVWVHGKQMSRESLAAKPRDLYCLSNTRMFGSLRPTACTVIFRVLRSEESSICWVSRILPLNLSVMSRV